MAEPRRRREALARRAGICALLAGLLALPGSVRGNMANPVEAGDRLGEPSGGLEQVAIEREDLEIDLRPLARKEGALVEAVYRVRNDGPRRRLNLLFVANALALGGSGVWLDDRPIPAAEGTAGELPESWRAPETTPAIAGGGGIGYEVEGEGTLSFPVTLSPGPHTIRVRYPARPTAHSMEDPTVVWQLGYVLAPAREWKEFGEMRVRVHLPAGWRAASEPALTREGDLLSATWEEIPADALALTVQAPPPGAGMYQLGLLLGACLGLAICLLAGRRLGRALGRRGRRSAWALPASLLLGFVWAVLVVVGFIAIPELVKERAGEQVAWTYGYGSGFLAIPLLPLLFLMGAIAIQVAAFRARRRALREGSGGVGAEVPAVATESRVGR